MNHHSLAIRLGLYWSLSVIFLQMLLYLLGHHLLHHWGINSMILLGGLAFMFYIGYSVRKENGGYINWKMAVTKIWLASVINIIITTTFQYILYNWIDQDLREEFVRVQIKAMESMKNLIGEENLEKTIEEIQNQNVFGLSNILKGLPFSILLYFIFSSIIALIIKKNNPDTGFENGISIKDHL